MSSYYTFIDKFEAFMLGGKVFINTRLFEFGDTLPVSIAIILHQLYTELIDDSYNPKTFNEAHPWCVWCVPRDPKEFRHRCMLLMFDVIMSCKEMLEDDGFLTTAIVKVSKAITIHEMDDIPIVIDDNVRMVGSSSGVALSRMYEELMKLKRQRNKAFSTRTRTYKHANGSMTLRPLRS